MAKNLVLKGNLEKPLILHNRTLSRTKSVSERIGHSIVAETVTDAVTPSDIIFSCLMDSDAVNGTFSTILQGDVTGKLFVECSTISPELTDELATKLQEAGAEFVAMPGKLIFAGACLKPGDLWLIQVHNSIRRTSNGRRWEPHMRPRRPSKIGRPDQALSSGSVSGALLVSWYLGKDSLLRISGT
jgi:hypothetical protein